MKEIPRLTPDEELLLQQLSTKKYWCERNQEKNVIPEEKGNENVEQSTVPELWKLTKDVSLYEWQNDCLQQFSGKGVVKVVTGAGKTIYALAQIEALQHINPSLRVLIVVPTIVLLNQWYDNIISHGNIPEEFIGRLGGGFSDTFKDKSKIIIVGVCNSVADKIDLLKDEYPKDLLLVADECHRYSGIQMRKIFEVKRAYSLGLSATPDVEFSNNDFVDQVEDGKTNEKELSNSEIVKSELGDIFYSLNYDDAIKAGLLPEFEIKHIALPLKSDERVVYDRLSREITDLREQIFSRYPDAPRGGDLNGWATNKVNRGRCSEEDKSLCNGYVAKVAQRKDIIYKAENRVAAVVRILKNFPQKQAILFDERIENVMNTWYVLVNEKISAVAEHSQLSESIRAESIRLFRKGYSKVISSGKALLEGFDAPAADIGINVSASGSITKAIQSIGRVLRKNLNSPDKLGLIIRFYIKDSIDEYIYKKCDFSSITGAKRNTFYFWDPSDESIAFEDLEPNEEGTPYSPTKKEQDLDWSKIQPGDLIDFDADGVDFQIDISNNVFKRLSSSKKMFVKNPQGVVEIIKKFEDLMHNNYFRQTNSNKIFIRNYNEVTDEWRWVFCGKLQERLIVEQNQESGALVEEFCIKQFRGKRLIQQAKAVDNKKRNLCDMHADLILEKIDSSDMCKLVNKLFIENERVVYCIINNERYNLCELPENRAFFRR